MIVERYPGLNLTVPSLTGVEEYEGVVLHEIDESLFPEVDVKEVIIIISEILATETSPAHYIGILLKVLILSSHQTKRNTTHVCEVKRAAVNLNEFGRIIVRIGSKCEYCVWINFR